MVLWVVFRANSSSSWQLPLGLLLTSFGWFEAWLPQNNGPGDVFKKMKEQKSNHFLNLTVSLFKIVAALTFFFVNIETRNLLTSYPMQASYEIRQQLVLKPGPPPGIPINEEWVYNMSMGGLICQPAVPTKTLSTLAFPEVPIHYGATANEAYPDDKDCSAYWTRECPSELP